MSVLQLTFSIADSVRFDVASSQRRRFVLGGGLVLFGLLVVYMYLAGSIVTANIERTHIVENLKNATAVSQSIERTALVKESMFTAAFFVSAGYEEPGNMGIIKRAHNVAEKQSGTIIY